MKRGNEARINHESESRQKRKKTGRAASMRIEVRMNKLLIRSESRQVDEVVREEGVRRIR